MKKILVLICTILCLCLLAACNEAPQVESYKLNENGNLIATFDDGTTQDLGTLEDTIANGVNKIEINSEDFYVINGIVTDIKAKVPVSYTLNADGKLIVTYNDESTKDLGNFENDAINVIDTIAISEDGYYVLNGVKTNIVATEVFEVSFDTGYSATLPKKNVKDGYKVELPDLTRTGYTLDGWYCNGEKWSFNANVVKNDMTLTAVWVANDYTVSFNTGITQTESDRVITYDSTYALPVLSRTGYTFDGWEYQGNLVTASKWNIATDCELVAKWAVNKYEVTLNANGGTVSLAKVNVEYGKAFTLPVASNEYGAFIGWFYGDEQITDANGNSLSNWTYTENLEFTTSWTIELSTADDLQQLYAYPNGYFELKNTIDISLIEWIPVGTDAKPFTGTINGCGHAINGLKITALQGNSAYYGFIGKATQGKVYDIIFSNINISLPAIQNTVYVGGVIGYNAGAEFSNVKTSGSITLANHSSSFESYGGGITGYSATNKIQNCQNHATVTAKNAAGGIIGAYMFNGNDSASYISSNSNFGNISNAIAAGGIVGLSLDNCLIANCLNTGIVEGIDYAGGVVGLCSSVVADKCSNIGNINTTSTQTNVSYLACGGIVGCVQDISSVATITNSYNQGDVSGENDAGGIIGFSFYVNVSNSYNSGSVTAGRMAAGIAGANPQYEITQCANFGTISGLMDATFAYTIGQMNAVLRDCYYNGSTSGITQIQGTKTTEKYAKSFYTGQMFWSDSVWTFFEDKLPELK